MEGDLLDEEGRRDDPSGDDPDLSLAVVAADVATVASGSLWVVVYDAKDLFDAVVVTAIVAVGVLCVAAPFLSVK